MSDVDCLALHASLILYKFTEGRESWSEYVDLANSLQSTLPQLSQPIAEIVARRIADFLSRI
jgi:hypothetical protein